MNTNASRSRVKLKYRARIAMGQSPPSTDYSPSPEDGPPFLQGAADFGAVSPTPRVYCKSPATLAKSGDILFSVRAPVGTINLADQEFGIGRGLCAIQPKQHWHSRFAWWALHEACYRLHFVSTGSTYSAVTIEDVANLLVETTTPGAQRAITYYLDRETARLDALVTAKERVLSLLTEKQLTLVSRAVAVGLNTDVPLRHSRISWCEHIPTHWEVWKLGHLAKIGNGSTPNRANNAYWKEGIIPWLNSSIVNQYEATKAEQFVTEYAVDECHLPIVPAGSVLIAITGQGKTRGRAVVLSFNATVNQHIAYVTPDSSRLDAWYLRWIFFSAYDFLRQISDDVGGTKGALTCEEISNFLLPVPPLEEQRCIVSCITSNTRKLKMLRSAIYRSKKLIKERRSSIVSSAVTGKIELEHNE